MKLKNVIAIAFGVAMIAPTIGFSENYNQMSEQAQNQSSDQQSYSDDNALMSEYGQQSSSSDNTLMSEYE